MLLNSEKPYLKRIYTNEKFVRVGVSELRSVNLPMGRRGVI